MEKDTHLHIRLSTAEKELIDSKAEQAGMKTSKWVRRELLGEETPEGIKDPVARDMLRTWNPVSSLR